MVNGKPTEVYQAAKVAFSKIGLLMTASGEALGVTDWRMGYVGQGTMSHSEKYRYKIVTQAIGEDHSTLRVTKESVPEKNNLIHLGNVLGSEMLSPKSVRDMPMESLVLQSFSPEEATK